MFQAGKWPVQRPWGRSRPSLEVELEHSEEGRVEGTETARVQGHHEDFG